MAHRNCRQSVGGVGLFLIESRTMTSATLRRMFHGQGTLKIIAGVVVVGVLAVLAYLDFLQSQPKPVQQSPQSVSDDMKLLAAYEPAERKINKALPSLDVVAKTPAMAKELAQTIGKCRHSRMADSLAGRTPGLDPFLGLGTTTNCRELFDTYGDRLDQALHHLKSSPDPVQRGYYYDANYDILGDNALAYQSAMPVGSAGRKLYEKLTDGHFEDVARDLDLCSSDAVARMHLSQKLTSPQYRNPAVGYFTSLILAAHDTSDTKLLAYSDRMANDSGLDSQTLARIKASAGKVIAKGCGIGDFSKELAVWKGYGGGTEPEVPPDQLDTTAPDPRPDRGGSDTASR